MDELTPSELLSAFIDNELDVDETSALFAMLASDRALQEEMRQMLAIRSTLAPLLAAPAGTEANIWRTAVGTVDARAGKRWGTTLFVVALFSALASALLTAYFWPRLATPSSIAQMPTLAQTSAASVGLGEMLSSSRLDISTVATDRATPIADRRATFTRRATPPSASRRVALPEPRLRSPIRAAVEATASDRDIDTLQTRAIAPRALAYTTDGSIDPATALPAPASTIAPIETSYSLDIRMIEPIVSENVDVAPISDPPINNLVIGIERSLGDEHTLGLYIGQENLLQSYAATIEQREMRIDQNYLALWGGVGYGFHPSIDIEGVRPYLQGIVGAARTGPMGRLTMGLERRFGEIGVRCGLEGMTTGYRYQGETYWSGGLNITCGLSMNIR